MNISTKLFKITSLVIFICGVIICITLHLTTYGDITTDNFLSKNYRMIISDYKIYYFIFTIFLFTTILNFIIKIFYKIKNLSLIIIPATGSSIFVVMYILFSLIQNIYLQFSSDVLYTTNLISSIISIIAAMFTTIMITRNICKEK